jgi:PucR C-terminal helix-turn-helix domain
MTATVNELLRSANLPGELRIAGGGAGLGREVRRVVRVRPTVEMATPFGTADLVALSQADWQAAPTPAEARPLISVLSSRVAGVIIDFGTNPAAIEAAERHATPLIHAVDVSGIDALVLALEHVLSTLHSGNAADEADLVDAFRDLADAGATPLMLVDRLVELTVKAGVLQDADWRIKCIRQPACDPLLAQVIDTAMTASAGPAEQWARETADPNLARLLYLELANAGVVRLMAPIWSGDQLHGFVSLVARAADLVGRDRVALLAAARAMPKFPNGNAVSARPHEFAAHGALALRAPRRASDEVARVAASWAQPLGGSLIGGDDDVRVWLPYSSRDEVLWLRLVRECHTHMNAVLGVISIGHAAPRGSGNGRALVEAAEALRIGERLFGPGHLTSYSDAQLARFLLGRPSTDDLRALYEQTVGRLAADDVRREGELLATLEAYCDSGCSVRRTAERLDIHRNTVQYRLKRIEDIKATSLEDGPSRLLLQVGLVAGRLVQRASLARR